MGSNSEQTIILISGANQGLGYEAVKKLAREQANYHILVGSRNPKRGEDAASSITDRAQNTTVTPVTLDITSDKSIQTAVDFVSTKFGRLDILFNNAAISYPHATGKTSRDKWLDVLNVNSISAHLVTEAFVPLLKKSSFPKVLFMSSGLGSISTTLDKKDTFYGLDSGAYAVSKTAMNEIGVLCAVKYRDVPFKVNVICPGHRATNLNDYNKIAGKAEDGALEAVRVITEGRDGGWTTWTNNEGVVPW